MGPISNVSFSLELSLVFPSRIDTFIWCFIQIIQETNPAVEENVFFRHDCLHSTISLIVPHSLHFACWHGKIYWAEEKPWNVLGWMETREIQSILKQFNKQKLSILILKMQILYSGDAFRWPIDGAPNGQVRQPFSSIPSDYFKDKVSVWHRNVLNSHILFL